MQPHAAALHEDEAFADVDDTVTAPVHLLAIVDLSLYRDEHNSSLGTLFGHEIFKTLDVALSTDRNRWWCRGLRYASRSERWRWRRWVY